MQEANAKRVIELEENCARLKRQLGMKQMEVQRLKDTCLQLEKQLKELQGALSPSPSKVCISQHCAVFIVLFSLYV